MLTRRHFVMTTTALFSAPIAGPAFVTAWPTEAQKQAWDEQVTPPDFDLMTSNPWGIHPRLMPARVASKDGLVPGDIHVDAIARYLYFIEEGGTAMRYGVAIGRGDLYEAGTFRIRRKVRWPHWVPTRGERDTYLRIHGTPQPWSIGSRASSGCVRMVMAHINELYPRVELGATAFLHPAEDAVTALS